MAVPLPTGTDTLYVACAIFRQFAYAQRHQFTRPFIVPSRSSRNCTVLQLRGDDDVVKRVAVATARCVLYLVARRFLDDHAVYKHSHRSRLSRSAPPG